MTKAESSTTQSSARRPPIRAANDFSILLRQTLGEDRFPVDIKSLALAYSSNFGDPIVRVEVIDIPGFEGMLRADRKTPGWQILLNANPIYRGRERFTLAHEFGHYALHRRHLTATDYPGGKLSSDVDFECLPLQYDQWQETERQREEEADTFASYLLMPIDDFRSQVGRQDITLPLLKHITARYGVSLLAAVRKWIEFSDRRAAMVVARDGFALWGRATDAALKTGIFVQSGMPIPEESIAARGPDSLPLDLDRPVELAPDVWRFKNEPEPTRELTIFSERLGLSVSILLFPQHGSRAWAGGGDAHAR